MLALILTSICAAMVSWIRARRAGASAPIPIGIQLAAALLVELTAGILASRGVNNHLLYSGYFLVEAALMFLLAFSLLNMKNIKALALLSICLYASGMIIELVLQENPSATMSTYITGALVLCVLFTVVLFRSAGSSDQLVREPLFWICLGLVLWFGGCIPFNGLVMYVYERDPELADELFAIDQWLCILRYGCIAVGCALYAPRPAHL